MRGGPYRRSLRDRLYSFMYGRYGGDALGRALLVCYLILFVPNLILRSSTIYLLGYALIVYALFRMLSKNITARRRENDWYLKRKGSVRTFFALQKNKWRDRKTHVYHRCPHCKSTLRLPRVKGSHTVNCPRCHTRFDMKI